MHIIYDEEPVNIQPISADEMPLGESVAREEARNLNNRSNIQTQIQNNIEEEHEENK